MEEREERRRNSLLRQVLMLERSIRDVFPEMNWASVTISNSGVYVSVSEYELTGEKYETLATPSRVLFDRYFCDGTWGNERSGELNDYLAEHGMLLKKGVERSA